MALVANTITRYDATKSVREDLSNVIYNISPTDTPFMSNAGRDTAKQTMFEHQTDNLAAAVNAPVIEGNDVHGVTDLRAKTQRVNNYTQINQKVVSSTGTLEAVDTAGFKSALAYHLAKAASEMKNDMELACLGLQIGNAGSNSVARATAGLGAWIITSAMPGAGVGAAPVMSGNAGGNPLDGYPITAAVAGTPRAFTESLFKQAMQKVWTEGGDPKVAFMNAGQKVVFSTFAGIATRFRDVPAGKQAQIVGAADLYVGDFGTVSVCVDRQCPVSTVYVGDTQYVALAYLRNFKTEHLAKTGDAERRMILCEWGLRVRAQKSWAAIHDLS